MGLPRRDSVRHGVISLWLYARCGTVRVSNVLISATDHGLEIILFKWVLILHQNAEQQKG